jgi:type I restriction enzyme, S subunit
LKLVPLGEVCTLEYGKPLDKEFRKSDGAFQAYGANGPISSATKYLIEGPCIIVGRKGSAGEISYVEENVWPLDVTYYIKHDPKESDLRYLFYVLKSLDIKQFVRGVKPGLNRNDVYQLLIPRPSLVKQREIVEKLDSAFAEIDLLEKNLRSGDEKANQLLQSILGGAFNANYVGVDLNLVPLKDFCRMYQPPTISTKEMIPNGEFVVYGANGPIGRYNKFNHEEPQLLVTCRGATCGAVNMSEPFSWINGNAMVIQPDLALASLEYMKYAFLGGIDVSSSITGSAQPQITRTTLEVIKVPLPSLEKQRDVVEKLDRAFEEIELLKGQIKAEKDHAAALRQSLLSGAFSQEEAIA